MENRADSPWVLERVVLGGLTRLHEGVTTIGRSANCNITIASDFVSRTHAELQIAPGTHYIQIKDLGSTNGIFVNDTVCNRAIRRLQVGDRIGIGVAVDDEFITEDGRYPIYVLKHEPLAHNNAIVGQPCEMIKENNKVEEKINAQANGDGQENGEDKENMLLPDAVAVPDLPIPPVMEIEHQSNKCFSVSDHEFDEDDDVDDFVGPQGIKLLELEGNIKLSPPNGQICSTISENIQSIFGDLNEDVLSNLSKQARDIAEANTTKSKPRKSADDNDVISISSDEETDTNRQKVTKSPDIFDDSFKSIENVQNEGIPNEQIQNERVKSEHLQSENVQSEHIQSEHVQIEPVQNVNNIVETNADPAETREAASRLDDVDDSEEEELYFTQQVLNDFKEELPETQTEYGLSEGGEVVNIQQENLPFHSNDYIVLDDHDDEYDAVLETKVTDWSLKLSSQSFSASFNSSPVYEDNVDNAHAAITEGIFINFDDKDDDSVGSGDAAKSDQCLNEVLNDPTFSGLITPSTSEKENDEDKDIAAESPLIRQWKKSSKYKYIFSSSEEDNLEEERCKHIPHTSGKNRKKRTHVRKHSTSEQLPQKKARLASESEEIEKDEENKVPKLHLQSSTPLKRHQRSDSVRQNSQSSKPKEKDPFDLLKADEKHVGSKADKEIRKHKDSSTNGYKCNDFDDKNKIQSHKSVSVADRQTSSAIEEDEADFEETLDPAQIIKIKANRGPEIIAPPQLPTNRGKLRGCSAVKQRCVQAIKFINVQKDLKQKWKEKPSVAKRKEKEKCQIIKEDRKQKLKELADKHKSDHANTKKSTVKGREYGKTSSEKPKVKVTQVNRGAFLTTDAVKAYKIPKTNAKPNNSQNKTCDSAAVQEPPCPGSSNSITKEVATSFSNELLRVDQILQNCNKPSTSAAAIRDQRQSQDVPIEQKVRAPPRRNSKKLTFYNMTEHLEETHRLQEIQVNLSKKSNIRNPLQRSNTKKTVRFNDVPQIRYIEAVLTATKKVDKKEPLTYSDRKQFIGRRFPTVDHTDELIADVLMWSQNWLQNRSTEFNRDGSNVMVYPMTKEFTSINNYKSIVFPLLKIEYLSHLERHMQRYASRPGYEVRIDYFTPLRNKELMFAKCFVPIKQSELSANDIVLIDIVNSNNQMIRCYGYIGNMRKTDTCTVLTVEIGQNIITTEHLKTFKQVTVRRIIEAIRVYFGSFNAVHQLEKTPLCEQILNPLNIVNVKTHYRPTIQYKGYDNLNPEQQEILLKTYAKAIDEYNPNISLINGPPGTGKSRLITNLALQFLYGNEVRRLDKKILICAQSNNAVDVIAQQLYAIQKKISERVTKYKIIRFGKDEKIHPAVRGITVSKLIERDHNARLQERSGSNEQTTIAENLKNEILKLEARVAELENENLRDVRQDELIELRKDLALKKSIQNGSIRPEDERRLFQLYLENANIICTTLSSCVKLSYYVKYFDICIIDEATQCIEPWGIMPLKFGVISLVMVGDTQQLPATLISQKAKDYGLGKSLFTRIQSCLENADIGDANPILTLRTQYRMHPEICKWPNMYFYKNLLLNSSTTTEFKSKIKPLSILNLQYKQNDQCRNGMIANNLEAEFVAELVKKLDAYLPNKYYSYGVITPYAQHREKLEMMTRQSRLRNVIVNTIDSYQGIEKDVIIISNARTQGIGFLADYQRLNVAVTRPKKCLILCGNFKNLESVPSWASLLANAKERGLFHDISIADAADFDKNVIQKLIIKR